MKKLFLSLAAILCCTMTTMVFTACGSDDNEPTVPTQPKIVSYQINYKVDLPMDKIDESTGSMFSLFEKIEIGYVDQNGQEQKEVVHNGKWEKAVSYSKSIDGYLKLYMTKPQQLNTEGLPYEKYKISVATGMILPNQKLGGITAIYDDGTRKDGVVENISVQQTMVSTTIGKEKLHEYFDNVLKGELKVMTIKISM